MSMKYIKLWGSSIAMNKVLYFKWEWAVSYERGYYLRTNEYKPIWEPILETFNSRREARQCKRLLNDANRYRNVKIMRRLVAVQWETYNDSYRHNAGAGKR